MLSTLFWAAKERNSSVAESDSAQHKYTKRSTHDQRAASYLCLCLSGYWLVWERHLIGSGNVVDCFPRWRRWSREKKSPCFFVSLSVACIVFLLISQTSVLQLQYTSSLENWWKSTHTCILWIFKHFLCCHHWVMGSFLAPFRFRLDTFNWKKWRQAEELLILLCDFLLSPANAGKWRAFRDYDINGLHRLSFFCLSAHVSQQGF